MLTFLAYKKKKLKYITIIVHCYSEHHEIDFVLCNDLGKNNQ